jgi:hypothetical protein
VLFGLTGFAEDLGTGGCLSGGQSSINTYDNLECRIRRAGSANAREVKNLDTESCPALRLVNRFTTSLPRLLLDLFGPERTDPVMVV